MFQRGLGKKGQEGVTLTTLILIVIGVVVAVVVILGATGGLDFFFDKIGSAPLQDLETNVQRCKLSLESNLNTDYCLEFKQIEVAGGETELINCEDSRVVASIQQSTGTAPTLNCAAIYSGSYETTKAAACNEISAGQRDKVRVNGGELCSDIIARSEFVGPTQQ